MNVKLVPVYSSSLLFTLYIFLPIYFDILHNLSFGWATLINNILEHFRVAARLSFAVRIYIPGAAILSRPLEAGEMPTTSCRFTSQFIPGTSVLSRPFEAGEMPTLF